MNLLAEMFPAKIKKPLYIMQSGFLVARRGIEPLLPEWKSGVLTPRRTGRFVYLTSLFRFDGANIEGDFISAKHFS